MKVKKYTAATMQHAMKKVKEDLGADAVILHSKVVETGGLFGLFTKKQIEVFAAADPDAAETPIVRNTGSTVLRSMQKNNFSKVHQAAPPESATAAPPPVHFTVPSPIGEIRSNLAEQGIGAERIDDLVNPLLTYWFQSPENQNIKRISEEAARLLKTAIAGYDFGGLDYSKQCIVLAGPTGVGKTTTIAKLAADCIVSRKKSAAFITTDTYRISAIDQLKTYAKILNVPIEICYSHEDFAEARKKFAGVDHIFVDTAGRNYKHGEYIEELRSLIGIDKEMDVFLTLSAAAKSKDIHDIIRHFEPLQVRQLIFTKLDETDTYGALYEAVVRSGKGIACFSSGQNVPDDLKPASHADVVHLLLGERR
ncbi:flagellar biosynthesis protein FlhF [Bacillus mangrovi]|uniref:Flagellar biosynthesis protein FlhF n=1 Tax=Metabacillus mangrovi TaxID=1491830 RepID=A0A7X2S4Q2_9BACI|nr:DEAD/DEAH box helicase [Metabacillus mangrovi]MTH52761.1 flagellar biosynthesis protein FlhF [Metabacillus mangrovi]